ncbi:MAG: hypothetical protein HRT44_07770 [Bdellovibrionales bacterium]|nr:hypothetical protein [Bdellovibrionales bacterium]NQZ19136.1 hypothetical protein [Bdellovibrionales bacterium]
MRLLAFSVTFIVFFQSYAFTLKPVDKDVKNHIKLMTSTSNTEVYL